MYKARGTPGLVCLWLYVCNVFIEGELSINGGSIIAFYSQKGRHPSAFEDAAEIQGVIVADDGGYFCYIIISAFQ